MDSGMEDRSRLRRHVRAAREWLGRAEDSLDRAEDVRGDLNLMLAQAELTRFGRGGWRRFARRRS